MSDWNQYKGDAAHSGIAPDREGPRLIEEAWTADLVGPVGTPVCDHDTVYVGTTRGNCYALEAETGRRRWTVETTQATDTAPVVTREFLYFGTEDGRIHAVDPATGDPRWERTLPGELGGAPTLADGRLYAPHERGVTALEPETGDPLWTAETEAAALEPPAVGDDRSWSGPRVFVGTADETVHAFEAADGEEVWSVPLGDDLAGAPTAVDGRVYVADGSGTMVALDGDSGQSWFSYDGTSRFTSSVTVLPGEDLAVDEIPTADGDAEGGTTFVGAADGYVHVTDTTFGRRKVRGWLFSKKGLALDGEVHATPVVVGGVVCVADTTGSIYGIDADRYDHWWHFAADGPVTSTPAVGDARLFVGSEDERLYCLEWTPGDQPGA
ncbi:PQQ-binding-like beta-propeller repeat protein [Halopiger goleimassiliensis]|uniref:PQQ-binding-like beta-propeller repeat protein n=1 Tax=Halopiger goleimassiliensis TaxID=1293048 RepID=UPI000677EDEE|nr:PQQ-binding-like beta-propeller repeat protein [Halopiger goleimassiliensis]